MIIPGDQVDAAVNRVPAGGNLVLRLLPLNRDRHGLAADLQHDHLAWSHARNLTRNVGQPWEPRRTGRHHHDMQRADRSPGHPPSRAHRQVPARAARSPGTLVVAGGAVEPRLSARGRGRRPSRACAWSCWLAGETADYPALYRVFHDWLVGPPLRAIVGMERSHLWHAALVGNVRRLGRAAEAAGELDTAAALAPTEGERRLLLSRLLDVRPEPA